MSENKSRTLWIMVGMGLFLLLLALILVIGLGGRSGNGTSKKKQPPRDLTDGNTLTREGFEEQGATAATPSKPVDTSRIALTYTPGKSYRTTVDSTIKSRGSHKDWGVTSVMSSHYVASYQFIRKIEKNDGKNLVFLQEFTHAESAMIYTEVENIKIDLGWFGDAGQTMLDIASIANAFPTGWSTFGVNRLNGILNTPLIKRAFSSVAQDKNAKLFVNVEPLMGKKARIHYRNGVGVTAIEPVGCTLTGDEQDLLFAISAFSDIFVFEDVDCEIGTTWDINGVDFLPIIDPSMNASLAGRLTVKRVKDGGTKENPTAVIKLDSGVLDFKDRTPEVAVAARWAPRGEMTYSFTDNIVTLAELTGNLTMQTKSVDHIIFEMENQVKPDYFIKYTCEVLD